TGKDPGLLSAPDRRRREILVQPRLKADPGRLEPALRAPQLPVEPAERRAAISGHEPGRRQPGARIELALRQQQTHGCLQPGDVQRAARASAAFVEVVDLAHPFRLPSHSTSSTAAAAAAAKLRRLSPPKPADALEVQGAPAAGDWC